MPFSNRSPIADVKVSIDSILENWAFLVGDTPPSTWGDVRIALNKISTEVGLPFISDGEGGAAVRAKINAISAVETTYSMTADFAANVYSVDVDGA